jgi:uncharacterized phage infection (PIP) family protein YhgE
MRDEVLKVEDVEGILQNRDEQLQRLAKEARQQESSTDPQTRQALDKIAQMASQGASDLTDAINQEGSKLQKEENQVEQLEQRYSNLSASEDGLGSGIGGFGGLIVAILAAVIAATLLL